MLFRFFKESVFSSGQLFVFDVTVDEGNRFLGVNKKVDKVTLRKEECSQQD